MITTVLSYLMTFFFIAIAGVCLIGYFTEYRIEAKLGAMTLAIVTAFLALASASLGGI